MSDIFIRLARWILMTVILDALKILIIEGLSILWAVLINLSSIYIDINQFGIEKFEIKVIDVYYNIERKLLNSIEGEYIEK